MSGRFAFWAFRKLIRFLNLFKFAVLELAVVCLVAHWSGVRRYFVDDGEKELRCLVIRIYFRRFLWRPGMWGSALTTRRFRGAPRLGRSLRFAALRGSQIRGRRCGGRRSSRRRRRR